MTTMVTLLAFNDEESQRRRQQHVNKKPNVDDVDGPSIEVDDDDSHRQSPDSLMSLTRKPTVHVEIPIQPSCPLSLQDLRETWRDFLERREVVDDRVPVASTPPALQQSLEHDSLRIQPEDESVGLGSETRDVHLVVHPYALNTEPPAVEELEPANGDQEWTAACDSLTLPHESLDGLWESLIFEDNGIPQSLLNYATSSLLFADKNVSPHLVNWNRLLLCHGPPGTGKTSLCRSLAQKLSIRLNARFVRSTLLEIHSHSLFSKWFSTSGKLIARLFDLVHDMVQDDPDCLICVLVDEIESLASSRAHLAGNGEPSDALRAVNSLLTSLDRLKTFANVLVLATTNLTSTLDAALLDRADLKIFVGLPCLEARYEILRSCCKEMLRVGLVNDDFGYLESYKIVAKAKADDVSHLLLSIAAESKGMSGRVLRKLPLQAHALFLTKHGGGEGNVGVSLEGFLWAMRKAVLAERRASALGAEEMDESDI